MKNFINVLFMSLLLFSCVKEDHTHDAQPLPLDDLITGTNSVTANWELNDLGDGVGFYSSSFSVPEITSDVVDNGAVLVYMTMSSWSDPEWVALPFTQVYGADYFSSVNYSFAPGTLTVVWIDSDYITPDYPNYDTFRTVVFEDRSSITDESILELIKKYEEQK